LLFGPGSFGEVVYECHVYMVECFARFIAIDGYREVRKGLAYFML